MQEFSCEYLNKIRNQITSIQKEVVELTKPTPLEEIKNLFGGELYKNNMLLKINKICSIEYISNYDKNKPYKVITVLYGIKNEKLYTKKELLELLSNNL